MKRILAGVLAALTLTCTANARELHLVTENALAVGFVDADTLKHTPTESEGWVTTFWFQDKAKPITKFHFVYKCTENKVKVDEMREFDQTGAEKSRIKPKSDWAEIIKGTNGDTLQTAICYEKFGDPDITAPARLNDAAMWRLLTAKAEIS